MPTYNNVWKKVKHAIGRRKQKPKTNVAYYHLLHAYPCNEHLSFFITFACNFCRQFQFWPFHLYNVFFVYHMCCVWIFGSFFPPPPLNFVFLFYLLRWILLNLRVFSIVLRFCFLWIYLLFFGGWQSIVKSKFGEQFVKGVVTTWCLSILEEIFKNLCVGLEFCKERFAFGCLLVWYWILIVVVQRVNGDLFFFCFSMCCFSITKLLNINFLLLISPFPSFSD